MKRKTKQTLKTLALSVLGIGALVGVASGINAFAEKQDTELKTIIPMFEVGGLKDTDGKYEETKGSIYTKQAFECQGLEIELDFDNTIKYQVFYYQKDGDFISSTDVLLGNQYLEVPFGATHARLEITPNWAEMGDDYKDTKNQEVKWYEVAKYSTQLDIKVNKEQSFDIETIIDGKENKAEILGQGSWNTSGGGFTQTDAPFYFFNKIDVSKSDIIIMKVKTSTLNNKLSYANATFSVPMMYDGTTDKVVSMEYSIVEKVEDYTYISYNVSNYTSLFGCVDVDSVEVLEIYIL